MTSRAAARLLLSSFLAALSAAARGAGDLGEGPEPDPRRHAVERFPDAVHLLPTEPIARR